MQAWIDLFKAYPLPCSMLALGLIVFFYVAFTMFKSRGGDD